MVTNYEKDDVKMSIQKAILVFKNKPYPDTTYCWGFICKKNH